MLIRLAPIAIPDPDLSQLGDTPDPFELLRVRVVVRDEVRQTVRDLARFN
jgi:hypothetical protein